jgi:hypothetical protein
MPASEDPRGDVTSAQQPAGGRPFVEPASPPQRYGPMTVMRYRKDDGRALILFERAPGGQDGAS